MRSQVSDFFDFFFNSVSFQSYLQLSGVRKDHDQYVMCNCINEV